MPLARYCKECKKNVWLKEDGNGQCAHPLGAISDIYEVEPQGEKLRPHKPFYSKVVGVTFKNEDGTGRQEILLRCKVGEKLFLFHAPMPGHPNAVKVCRKSGQQIGHLSSELAEEIAPTLDKGGRVDVEISDLRGGGFLFKTTRGCNIKITRYSLR